MNIYEKKFFAALDKVISEDDEIDASGAPIVTDKPPSDPDQAAKQDGEAFEQGNSPELNVKLNADKNFQSQLGDDVENVVNTVKGYGEELSKHLKQLEMRFDETANFLSQLVDEKCLGSFNGLADKLNLNDAITAIIKQGGDVRKAIALAASQLKSQVPEQYFNKMAKERAQ